MELLYPICRSITGAGVRATLAAIREHVPIELHEVPTGTPVFDWIVPREWNIRDAYVQNSRGEKIIDFKRSNLHVLNYGVPIRTTCSLRELRAHLFTLPEHPDWIPYVTSYYHERWGFCVPHRLYEQLEEDTYEVVIDASLEAGSLTYGEYYLQGERAEEVLLSTYVCHPSLCNDNLSGVVLLTFLARALRQQRRLKYSYRFLFLPETIGAIAWLARNERVVRNVRHGLVVTCVGDRGGITYQRTRGGSAEIDIVVERVLEESGDSYTVKDFFPCPRTDERQFSSPAFDLPVGVLTRTRPGAYPEYHTSADDLRFVSVPHLVDSLEKYLQVVFMLERNATYVNTNPKCEPQLGKRGLYRQIGAQDGWVPDETALLATLNLADGRHSLLDIAKQACLRFDEAHRAAEALAAVGLLHEVELNPVRTVHAGSNDRQGR